MNLQNAINICINEFINPLEKFESKPYQCPAGIWTVGYGTTYIKGIAVTANTAPITLQQAEQYRDATLHEFDNQIVELLTCKLTDNQFASCLSLVYNIGVSSFKYSTLLKMININPNDINIRNEWLKWNHIAKSVSKGLTIRRQKEIDFYFS